VHEGVRAVVDVYLGAVDAEAPGLVEGLYLTGSTALGEFRPRTSDIDYVAVTAKPPDALAVAALRRAHRQLRRRHPRPYFDGRYVTWDDLASDPRAVGPGPSSYDGVFSARGRRDCDPVAWHTVARHGVACRGPEPSSVCIWIEPAALTTWTLDNFDAYWRPLLASARRGAGAWRLTSYTSYGAVWIVLGVCRLHYTLATGSIASKAQAGEYGLRTFPDRWHRILNEALAIRHADRARPDVASAAAEMLADLGWRGRPTTLYASPAARRRDVLAFADMVIADATAPVRPDAGSSSRW
jgi:hypothetical protein